jgi:hypothetical protein
MLMNLASFLINLIVVLSYSNLSIKTWLIRAFLSTIYNWKEFFILFAQNLEELSKLHAFLLWQLPNDTIRLKFKSWFLITTFMNRWFCNFILVININEFISHRYD